MLDGALMGRVAMPSEFVMTLYKKSRARDIGEGTVLLRKTIVWKKGT
jgi:hypothetical protein